MKKKMVLLLVFLFTATTLSLCSADDQAEGHICFKRIDADHDGIVTFEEFKLFFGDDKEKYKIMDQDSDGSLTHDEYEEYRYNRED